MAYGAVTITTTPKIIVSANTKRQELTLVNYSQSVDIFVGPDASVSISTGTPIFALMRTDRWKGPGVSWKGPIYGVCSSTADIRWWEVEQ